MADTYDLTDRVQFLGEVSADVLAELMRRATILVSPSEFESFGMAVLEGIAYGNIMLASDIPAHRELIEHGQTGFLIDFHDSDRVAKTIMELLRMSEAKQRNIRQSARESALPYSIERACSRLEGVYDRVRAESRH